MKKLFFKMIKFSGLPFLVRELVQRNKVTILLFHDINKEVAENTFLYLKKNYNIISLNEFIKYHQQKNKTKLPKKALIITFDDGHIGNYKLLSILVKHNVLVTIFLCTSIINTNRHFWFRYKNQSIGTKNLKCKSNIEKLKTLTKVGFEQEKEFEKPQALQIDHINKMKQHVDFQSHTMFHPILPKCDSKEATKEIFNSKHMLEKEYGISVNAIAYPNGDYSDRDINLVKKAGYKCGITVDHGFNNLETDLFRLKRLSVNDTNDLNELIVKSTGIWSFFKTLNGSFQSYGYSNNVIK